MPSATPVWFHDPSRRERFRRPRSRRTVRRPIGRVVRATARGTGKRADRTAPPDSDHHCTAGAFDWTCGPWLVAGLPPAADADRIAARYDASHGRWATNAKAGRSYGDPDRGGRCGLSPSGSPVRSAKERDLRRDDLCRAGSEQQGTRVPRPSDLPIRRGAAADHGGTFPLRSGTISNRLAAGPVGRPRGHRVGPLGHPSARRLRRGGMGRLLDGTASGPGLGSGRRSASGLVAELAGSWDVGDDRRYVRPGHSGDRRHPRRGAAPTDTGTLRHARRRTRADYQREVHGLARSASRNGYPAGKSTCLRTAPAIVARPRPDGGPVTDRPARRHVAGARIRMGCRYRTGSGPPRLVDRLVGAIRPSAVRTRSLLCGRLPTGRLVVLLSAGVRVQEHAGRSRPDDRSGRRGGRDLAASASPSGSRACRRSGGTKCCGSAGSWGCVGRRPR